MNNFWCTFMPIFVGIGGAWIGGLIGWFMRRRRIAELEGVIEEKEADNLHLKNNNEMLNIRVENIQNEYTRLGANHSVLEDKHTKLQGEYNILETTNRVLSAQLNAVNEKNSQLSFAASEVKENPLEAEIIKLQEELSLKNSHILAIENKLENLQSAQSQLEIENEKQNTEGVVIHNAAYETDNVSELTENTHSINTLQSKYTELTEAHTILLSELEKRSNRISEIFASKEEWRQAYLELENKLDNEEQKIAELQKLNTEWEQAFLDINEKYKNLTIENDNITQTTVSATDNDALNQELIYTQNAKAQLEITRIKLENELEILRGQYEELQQAKSNTSEINQESIQRLEYLEEQNEKLSREIEAIKADAIEKERKLTDTHRISSNLWQTRYTNILNELDEYKAQITALKSAETAHQIRLHEWENMYDELVIAFQEKHEAYSALLESSKEDNAPLVVEEKISNNGQTPESIVNTVIETNDDLKVVEGIGPKIEDVLKNAGILTFEQLANTPTDKISEILEAAGSQFKMHDPTTWATQAELAAQHEWEKLKAYQDYLLGGRDIGNN